MLIVAGGLLIADAGITLVWQEPVSALYASVRQSQLGDDLNRARDAADRAGRAARPQAPAHREAPDRVPGPRRCGGKAKPGDPMGRIKIPKIGVNFVIVQGTDAGDLRKGPGHYVDTPMPGEPGTVAIAGHRTTYLAPFRNIDELQAQRPDHVEMPYADFMYSVERMRVVDPSATWVMRRSATTGSCSRRATRCTGPRSGSSCSRGWSR